VIDRRRDLAAKAALTIRKPRHLRRFARVTERGKCDNCWQNANRRIWLMAEHKHGSMDISDQEKTFDGFIKFTIRTVYVILVLVILMAIFNA
jgi:uncharacterized protein (UPF0548 family)